MSVDLGLWVTTQSKNYGYSSYGAGEKDVRVQTCMLGEEEEDYLLPTQSR